jgi:hypothetical protein
MENDGAALASTVMAGRVLREGRDGKLSTDLHRADEGDGEKGKINLMDESHFKSSVKRRRRTHAQQAAGHPRRRRMKMEPSRADPSLS